MLIYPLIWFVLVFRAKITSRSANVLFPIHLFCPFSTHPPATYVITNKKNALIKHNQSIRSIDYLILSSYFLVVFNWKKEFFSQQKVLTHEKCWLTSSSWSGFLLLFSWLKKELGQYKTFVAVVFKELASLP